MSFGQNYNVISDLNELDRLINSLDSYLKGNELYGSVGGGFLTGGTNPQLTVGAILMRLRRLEVLSDELSAEQQQKLSDLQSRHVAIRDDLTDQYVAKVEREANSRLDAMTRFFEECREDRSNCARIYNPEALRRTIVQEILLALDSANITSQDLDEKARKTDRNFRSLLTETDFIWDEQLKEAYPKETFWWLYMAPPA